MTQSYPVLPLRDIVVFPHMIVPLFVGRDKSVAALEAAMAADKEIFLVAQLDPAEDDPEREDLYDIGVTATVLQLLKLPDGTVRVLVEGKVRAALDTLSATDTYLTATVLPVEEPVAEGNEVSGADALGGRPVRELRQAQPQAAGRDRRPARRDRGCVAPGRCGRREHLGQGVRQAVAAGRDPIRPSAWRWRSPSWKASSASCRSRRRSRAASSARWRRPSANITSTSS